jgi:hypothetical protein
VGVRRIAIALGAGISIVAVRGLQAMSPCRPADVAPLTGTLIEVSQDDVPVSTEAAILNGLPRRICLNATDPNGGNDAVRIVDCDYPHFEIDVRLEP